MRGLLLQMVPLQMQMVPLQMVPWQVVACLVHSQPLTGGTLLAGVCEVHLAARPLHVCAGFAYQQWGLTWRGLTSEARVQSSVWPTSAMVQFTHGALGTLPALQQQSACTKHGGCAQRSVQVQTERLLWHPCACIHVAG